jgi:hypothetical protein
MKTAIALLTLALATSAVAQQADTTQRQPTNKPSAAVGSTRYGTRAHTRPLAQPQTTSDAMALPVGTAIRMKLETPLSTVTTKRGDRFGGRVVEAVMLNGKTVIPVGAALEGDVVRSEEMRRIRGTPTIDLRPDHVTLPDGSRYMINGTIVDTSNRGDVNVNDEGEIKGKGHDNRDLLETGAGAGIGLGIGAKVGGVKGAFIGAGIGATASMVHWLTKTKTAYLPAGTEIIMELSRPMQLNVIEAGD